MELNIKLFNIQGEINNMIVTPISMSKEFDDSGMDFGGSLTFTHNELKQLETQEQLDKLIKYKLKIFYVSIYLALEDQQVYTNFSSEYMTDFTEQDLSYVKIRKELPRELEEHI